MNAFSYKIIGKHLRNARKRQKLRQEDVARLADVSLPYYGKLERGGVCPNMDRLIRVCKVLRIPLAEVCKGVMPQEESLSPEVQDDDRFATFFSHLGERVDDNMKSVMIEVCRQIETLDQ